MAEIGALAKDLFAYLVGIGGPAFAVLGAWTAALWWENRSLKKRVETLSDQLITDGRDATDRLLEISAHKLMNEASTSKALTDLASALNPQGRRK